MRYMIAVVALAAAVSGCVSNRPVRGVVPRAEVAQYFLLDFGYFDQRRDARYLHDDLGDFTIIAFTRCDQDTHGPVAKLVEELVTEHRGIDSVRIVGIDIHWSDEDCALHDTCHLVTDRSDLISICDAAGAIHRSFDDDANDYLVVVGPGRKIVAMARANDTKTLREVLRQQVERLAGRSASLTSQELDE